ncbi:hypothetical protein TNCV_798901 [Trichonephila clavipes]|nr:hypothetical protein TNCV_798901 [Trichonephila clavipes]
MGHGHSPELVGRRDADDAKYRMRKTLMPVQMQLISVRKYCAKLPAELLEILEIVQFVNAMVQMVIASSYAQNLLADLLILMIQIAPTIVPVCSKSSI